MSELPPDTALVKVDIICRTCKFFDKDEDDDEIGDCRRYPPRPVALGEGEWHTLFPMVHPSLFCGEWQPNPVTIQKLNLEREKWLQKKTDQVAKEIKQKVDRMLEEDENSPVKPKKPVLN